jgi:hypothetical protein
MSVNDLSRDHATHDELLVVAFASGDLEARDAGRAERLVVGCTACAALDADIRALRAATAGIARHHAPRRNRDFRIPPHEAVRVRPASPWRRAISALAAPRAALLAPLGGAVAALGLVGILVLGGGLSGLAGSASSDGAAPALQAASEGLKSGTAAGAPSDVTAVVSPAADGAAAASGGAAPAAVGTFATGEGSTPLPAEPSFDPGVLLSFGLLALGALLVVARLLARALHRR